MKFLNTKPFQNKSNKKITAEIGITTGSRTVKGEIKHIKIDATANLIFNRRSNFHFQK